MLLFSDTNECTSTPCQNGGNCTDQVNGYSCTCEDGYEGINCDTGGIQFWCGTIGDELIKILIISRVCEVHYNSKCE